MSEKRFKRKVQGLSQSLTKKQRALYRAKIKNPEATMSELAIQSGYADKHKVWSALQSPTMITAMEEARTIIRAREKLRLESLMSKIEEGLEATEIRSVKLEGDRIKVSVETPDHYCRHKFLETALDLHGARENKSAPISSGPINIAVILAGGGTDAEKQAIADVLIASRIARGLHPRENRQISEKEKGYYLNP